MIFFENLTSDSRRRRNWIFRTEENFENGGVLTFCRGGAARLGRSPPSRRSNYSPEKMKIFIRVLHFFRKLEREERVLFFVERGNDLKMF